jgi:Calcineurin-like phosphoesterase
MSRLRERQHSLAQPLDVSSSTMATPTNLTWRTRRTAIIIIFIPIIAIYVLYSFKAHTLFPLLSTWPFQRKIVTNAKDMMRHELWPWTIHVEKTKDSERHPFIRHIVAVGDLHGDLPNARRVLEFSGVTDDFGDWSGDVDFFVQTGDIIDRCAEHLSTISYIWLNKILI